MNKCTHTSLWGLSFKCTNVQWGTGQFKTLNMTEVIEVSVPSYSRLTNLFLVQLLLGRGAVCNDLLT